MQAHIRFPVLESRIRHLWNAGLILLLALCSTLAWAQSSQVPYTARITGENVLVRSGPGTDQYQCGRLGRNDTVQVLNQQNGWARIVPPPGSFSWISMQYVNITLRDPSVGTVTGNDIRVYAGSDIIPPMHSTAKQAELKRGDKVKLMGEEKDGYFKIVPPRDAVLYVSSHYLESVGPSVTPATPATMTPVVTDTPTVTMISDPNELMVADANGVAEPNEDFMVAFRALQDQVNAERIKPLAEQNYDTCKQALAVLAQSQETEIAQRYTEYLQQRIAAYELVQQVNVDLEAQDTALETATSRINKSRVEQLRAISQQGHPTVIGTLKRSAIYTGASIKRYRVIDDEGKTLCYAQPVGALASRDFSSMVGKKVGLTGTIKAQPSIGSALIEFTKIEVLEITPQ